MNTTDIVGSWELREEQNGMIPARTHAQGNGNIYKFSATSYERFSNGGIVKRGEYAVVGDSTAGEELGLAIPAGQFTNRIIFDNDSTSAKIFFAITNDSLTFLSGYFPTDGGSKSIYIRQ
jgi:hypothetical protein